MEVDNLQSPEAHQSIVPMFQAASSRAYASTSAAPHLPLSTVQAIGTGFLLKQP